MTRLLWLSRHPMTKKQRRELEDYFGGDFEIVQKSCRINGGKDVKHLMKRYNCDEVFVVLPYELKQELVELGIHPIQANIKRVGVKRNGKKKKVFRHQGFERLHDVNIKKNPLSKDNAVV